VFGAVGCEKDEKQNVSPPGELEVGIARMRMPAPVGIPTVGFNGLGVSGPDSPFAKMFPATRRVHGHPELRALWISRGPQWEVIFLRGDMVGVFQHFRRAVVLEVEARLGRTIDDALIFTGTHTHSGPGRVINGGGFYDMIADTFFPEYYERMVDAAATVLLAAYADRAPARIGHTWTACAAGHSDRRCEDGRDYTNGAIPVVAVERAGRIDAVLFAYAVHGVGIDREDYTLSRDVSGAIEQSLEERFDHPVTAFFLNSWAADMGLGNPDVELQEGAAQPAGYLQIHKIGAVVADAIFGALTDITFQSEPEVFASLHRVRLDREAIGYGEDEFPYEWGAVFCGMSDEPDCDPATTLEGLDHNCFPAPEENPAPPQTEIAAGRIGTLAFVTMPGEPTTGLSEGLLTRLERLLGFSDVMVVGFAQDYSGYLLAEHDWWQGGYEASGSLWGPRQGEYLASQCAAVVHRALVLGPHGPRAPAAPPPITPFAAGDYSPYTLTPTATADIGTVVQDASPLVEVDEVVTFAVQGDDPWLGTPLATLQDEGGGTVTMANGRAVTSDDYAFWVDLRVIPTYKEDRTAERRNFVWTFSMPAQQRTGDYLPPLSGSTWQLEVVLPTRDGEQTVVSSPFSVP
jgi:hypothetical protein